MDAREHAVEAAKHHTDLNTFAAVIALLEGGTIYRADADAQRVIKICKAATQKSLRSHDRHLAHVERLSS